MRLKPDAAMLLPNYLMKFFFLSLILMAGCATEAQKKMTGISENLDTGMSSAKACINDVQTKPKYNILSRYYPQNDDFSLEQLTNQSLPTDAEAKLYIQFANEMKSCRRIVLETLNKVSPYVKAEVMSYELQLDKVSIEIAQRKITWGEASRKVKEISVAENNELLRVSSQIESSLNQQHNAELQSRRAAGEALGEALQTSGYALQQGIYQQQVLRQNRQNLSNANRSINTSCNNFGSTINCSSY